MRLLLPAAVYRIRASAESLLTTHSRRRLAVAAHADNLPNMLSAVYKCCCAWSPLSYCAHGVAWQWGVSQRGGVGI